MTKPARAGSGRPRPFIPVQRCTLYVATVTIEPTTLGAIGTAGARSKDKCGTKGPPAWRPCQVEARARARESTVGESAVVGSRRRRALRDNRLIPLPRLRCAISPLSGQAKGPSRPHPEAAKANSSPTHPGDGSRHVLARRGPRPGSGGTCASTSSSQRVKPSGRRSHNSLDSHGLLPARSSIALLDWIRASLTAGWPILPR